MELIPLSGYTPNEKLAIAQQFLVPKQREANGLEAPSRSRSPTTRSSRSSRDYTREAGVRNLEREIGSVCRKVARDASSEEGETPDRDRRREPPRVPRQARSSATARKGESSEVGIATGLAWTEAGGEILTTETSLLKGRAT